LVSANQRGKTLNTREGISIIREGCWGKKRGQRTEATTKGGRKGGIREKTDHKDHQSKREAENTLCRWRQSPHERGAGGLGPCDPDGPKAVLEPGLDSLIKRGKGFKKGKNWGRWLGGNSSRR